MGYFSGNFDRIRGRIEGNTKDKIRYYIVVDVIVVKFQSKSGTIKKLGSK